MSQEMNCKLGQEVGYRYTHIPPLLINLNFPLISALISPYSALSIRFEDCTSDSTVIKYMVIRNMYCILCIFCKLNIYNLR